MADDFWNSNNLPWGHGGSAVGERLPVMIISDAFLQADSPFLGEETGTTNFLLERVGIPLVAEFVHPSSIKLITRIWFVIEGTVGDQISVSMGAQEKDSQEAPIYLPPEIYTIGTTESIDGIISGRYACIKLEATDIDPWTLVRYQIDFEVIGRN